MNILITVDTELWPLHAKWPTQRLPATKTGFTHEVEAFIYGGTKQGEFGLRYLLDQFRNHDLNATFFVEALSAPRIGPALTAEWVHDIVRARQEIGLHVHTEWLGEAPVAGVPTEHRQFLHQYGRAEQEAILAAGIANLKTAGAPSPAAFRAGSYGANLATLSALSAVGIPIDSSHNPTNANSFPEEQHELPSCAPQKIGAVTEFPIAWFADYPGHRRHAQLTACSFSEMKNALKAAGKAQWPYFVIVMHSFELVQFERAKQGAEIKPNHLVIARLNQLCQWLAAHKMEYPTIHFRDIPLENLPTTQTPSGIYGNPLYTLGRMGAQLANRFA